MIQEMGKLRIIGPKSLLSECIRALHLLSVVHIETVPIERAPDSEGPEGSAQAKTPAKAEGPESGGIENFLSRIPLEEEKVLEKRRLEKELQRVTALLTLLVRPGSPTIPATQGIPATPEAPPSPPEVGYEELDSRLSALGPAETEARAAVAERDALTDELKTIERYERVLRVFAPMVTTLGHLKSADIVGLTIDRSRGSVTALLEAEVGEITRGGYVMHKRAVDEETLGVLLAFNKTHSTRVRALLTGEAISEVMLPEEYREVPFLTALSKMVTRKEALPGAIAELEARLNALSRRWQREAEAIRRALLDALEELGTLNYCAESRHCFFIEGWAPKEELPGVRAGFDSAFGGRVLTRELDTSNTGEAQYDEALVPVCIKNPVWLKPFEIFLNFLPTPKYHSVDPTPWIAFFFPVFFGLIVGDLGYGLVLLALGLYIGKRFGDKGLISDISRVLCVNAVSAAFFGVVFGEFFGDLPHRTGLLPHDMAPLFDRMEALELFLAISLGIGIGHVMLGLLIAITNHLRRGRNKKAMHKFTMLSLLVSFLFITAVVLERLPGGLLGPGLIVFAANFVALAAMEGVLGVVEFIKAIGNILSYMRIMAVGTASVVMALVANEAGAMAGGVVAGVLVAVCLHSLNITLAVLSPTVQSLRLQYVEFLSKFYEGGGRRYEPFKKSR